MSAWTYLGYSCELHGNSYSCPALKLYGYATERALYGAIRRTLRKAGKLEDGA